MRWLRSTRKALLLAALALGLVAVVVVAVAIGEDEVADGFAVLPIGVAFLSPLALPLFVLRSRWYRLVALTCALACGYVYALFALGGAFLLLPSALLVALTVLTPQPP